MNGPALVLASASPRRADYLRMLGLSFEVCPADVDESVLEGESPEAHVERLAVSKARVVAAQRPEDLILAGDTVVVLDGEILGKPRGAPHAVEMLVRLRGREHQVLSGLALRCPSGEVFSGVSETRVRFRDFDRLVAEAYVATEEPLDKAGAYGIQGRGAAVVAGIQGDYYTVVGLPIPLMLSLFRSAGWRYDFNALVRAEPTS